MTGYLARLAARAGGEPAAAAPRVPSRFEPVATGGQAAAFAAPGAVRELRHEPRQGDEVGHEPQPELRPGVDVEDQGARELDRTGGHGRPDTRDSAGGAEPDAAGRSRPAAPPWTSSPREGARADAVATTPGEASASANGLHAPARQGTGTARPPADPVGTPAAPRRRAAASPRPPQGSVAEHSDATGRAERVDRGDRPEDVHVTIDRVEVRATIAAPAVAPTASGADAHRESSRSLHDYLAGRSR